MKEYMQRNAPHGPDAPRMKLQEGDGEKVLCTRCRRWIASVTWVGVATRDGKGDALHEIDFGPDRPTFRYVAARCKRCKRLHFLKWGCAGIDDDAGEVIKYIDP